MADEIFYESKMLKRSWTWQEWKRDWNQIHNEKLAEWKSKNTDPIQLSLF